MCIFVLRKKNEKDSVSENSKEKECENEKGKEKNFLYVPSSCLPPNI